MRIKADLYSGLLFEYREPKARPLAATGHQPAICQSPLDGMRLSNYT